MMLVCPLDSHRTCGVDVTPDLNAWWAARRPGEDRVVSARAWTLNPNAPDEPVDRAVYGYLETDGRYNPRMAWARTLDDREPLRRWLEAEVMPLAPRDVSDLLDLLYWKQVGYYLRVMAAKPGLCPALLHPFFTSRECQEGAYAKAPEDFVALWRGPGREHKPLPNQGRSDDSQRIDGRGLHRSVRRPADPGTARPVGRDGVQPG